MGRSAFSLFINVWNIIIGCIITVAGVMRGWGSFGAVVIAATIVMFGIVTIIVEIKPPSILITLFGWYRWWAGRGVFYIIIGCFCWSGYWNGSHGDWKWGFGIIPLITGIIYIILHFVGPSLPGPISGNGYSKI